MSAIPKKVVLVDGKRVSKKVHTNESSLNAEVSEHVRILNESGGQNSESRVSVKELIEG